MAFDIESAVDLATRVAGLIEAAASGARKLRGKSGGCPPELVEQILAVSEIVFDAKAEMARLQPQLEAAKTALAVDHEIQQRKRNYEKTKTAVGEVVYRLKEGAHPGDVPHEVCPQCYEDDEIRILQTRGDALQCLNCGASFRTKEPSGPTVVPRRPDPRFEGFV
ncbi:MAG: hypothetical protein F4X59_17505 [Holophagales bacterium]|nr:hypothetical protein [Holophagales bacterium]MYC11903.1 hypothetical protein [Holophagales bacterium]